MCTARESETSINKEEPDIFPSKKGSLTYLLYSSFKPTFQVIDLKPMY